MADLEYQRDPINALAAKNAGDAYTAAAERQRQQSFAKWLQDQGMAPGTNLPQETGGEFTGFLKAGGLKEYAEQEREKRSGMALADTYDQMAKHEKMAPYKEMLGSLSQGLRSGGMTRADAQATLKPVLERAFMPDMQDMSAMTGGDVDKPFSRWKTSMTIDNQGKQRIHPTTKGESDWNKDASDVISGLRNQGVKLDSLQDAQKIKDPQMRNLAIKAMTHISITKPPVPVTPGSDVYGRTAVGQPGAEPMASRPITPPAGELKEMATYDTQVGVLDRINQLSQDPEVQRLTGAFIQNPQGAMQRLGGEGGIKIPGTDIALYQHDVPPQFAEYQAMLRQHRLNAQKVLEGLRANQAVLKYGAPAFPSENDPIPVAQAKMNAWRQFYTDHRQDIEKALKGAGMSAPTGRASQMPPKPEKQGQGTAPATSPTGQLGTPGSAGVSGPKRPTFAEWDKRQR